MNNEYQLNRYKQVVKHFYDILLANTKIKKTVKNKFNIFLKKYPMDGSNGYRISNNTYNTIDNILHHVWALDDIKSFYNKIKIHKFDTSITDRIWELGKSAHLLFLDLNKDFNQNEKSSNFILPWEKKRKYKNEINYCIYTELPEQDRYVIERKFYEELANHMLYVRELRDVALYLEKYAKKLIVTNKKNKKLFRKRLSNKNDSFEDYEPLKIECKHTYGHFKVYSDSSITYKNIKLKLNPQKLKILDLFLSRNKQAITKETIIKHLGKDKDPNTDKYIKYLTPIRNELKRVTGQKRKWILHGEYGWTLNL